MTNKFSEFFSTPVSALQSVELKELPAQKGDPSLQVATAVEIKEYSARRVRASVTFRAWTEPRGILDFRSVWKLSIPAHRELPSRQAFEKLAKEVVYPSATKNSLLLAFLSSTMVSDGVSLVLSPRVWLDHITEISWSAVDE